MTIQQWADKEMKKAGIFVKDRTYDPHWAKAYVYTFGKGLKISKLYSQPQ